MQRAIIRRRRRLPAGGVGGGGGSSSCYSSGVIKNIGINVAAMQTHETSLLFNPQYSQEQQKCQLDQQNSLKQQNRKQKYHVLDFKNVVPVVGSGAGTATAPATTQAGGSHGSSILCQDDTEQVEKSQKSHQYHTATFSQQPQSQSLKQQAGRLDVHSLMDPISASDSLSFKIDEPSCKTAVSPYPLSKSRPEVRRVYDLFFFFFWSGCGERERSESLTKMILCVSFSLR